MFFLYFYVNIFFRICQAPQKSPKTRVFKRFSKKCFPFSVFVLPDFFITSFQLFSNFFSLYYFLPKFQFQFHLHFHIHFHIQYLLELLPKQNSANLSCFFFEKSSHTLKKPLFFIFFILFALRAVFKARNFRL